MSSLCFLSDGKVLVGTNQHLLYFTVSLDCAAAASEEKSISNYLIGVGGGGDVQNNLPMLRQGSPGSGRSIASSPSSSTSSSSSRLRYVCELLRCPTHSTVHYSTQTQSLTPSSAEDKRINIVSVWQLVTSSFSGQSSITNVLIDFKKLQHNNSN